MITPKVLRAVAPHIKPAVADVLAPALRDAMGHAQISTALRQAHFLAQAAHESRGFTSFVENLNYSAEGLLQTFPKYFTAAQAKRYARKPAEIANHAYAKRNGNGSEASGDGWRFRGRGIFQLTGRANYRTYGKALGLPLEESPALAAELANAARIAAEYWRRNGINDEADRDDIKAVTRIINGGLSHLDERETYLRRAKLQLMPKPVKPFAVVDGEARVGMVGAAKGGGDSALDVRDTTARHETDHDAGGTDGVTFYDDGTMTGPDGEPVPGWGYETGAPAGAEVRRDDGDRAIEEDPLIGPNSPERLVKALQEELNARNYDCGADNGDFGSLTRSAVLSLKANEGLDTSTATIRLSEVEAAAPWVVPGRQDKTVKDLRRAGDPTVTLTGRIKAAAYWVLGLFGIGGGATAVKDSGGEQSGSVLDKADHVLSLWERVQAVAGPVSHMFLGLLQWLWMPAIAAIGLAWWLSRRAEAKRLEDYKAARML